MINQPPVSSLAWRGGKSGNQPIGRWVFSVVGDGQERCYVEPFGGMAGVLLQRQRSYVEVLNDLDDRVANFWRVVSQDPSSLTRRLRRLPRRSRRTFEWARGAVDDPALPPLDRATAFITLVDESLSRGMSTWHSPRAGSYAARYTPCGKAIDGRWAAALARRLRGVHLENRDGVDLIRYHAHDEKALIYVDQPYLGRSHSTYKAAVDREALAEAMLACAGRVVVSGCDGEWDHLGWRRYERPHRAAIAPHSEGGKRLEMIWENRAAPTVNRTISKGGMT